MGGDSGDKLGDYVAVLEREAKQNGELPKVEIKCDLSYTLKLPASKVDRDIVTVPEVFASAALAPVKAAARALGFTPGGAGGHSTRRCECDALWTGRDCCTPRRTEACPHGCSGHGICAAGRCQCEHGWSGESCAVVDAFACPRAFSAHGRCRRDGTCECERGFSGAACEHGDPYGAVSTNDLLRHT